MNIDYVLSAHGVVNGKSKGELNPPKNLVISDLAYEQNGTISWDAVEEAELGYRYKVLVNGVVVIEQDTLGTIHTINSSYFSVGDEVYFEVRARRTDGTIGSEYTSSQTVVVGKGFQTSPPSPTVSAIGANQATVTGIENTEVRLGSGQWHPSPHTFTGLDIVTNYTVYARKSENVNYLASEPSSGTTFTTDKGSQTAPNAPSVSNIQDDRVTVSGETDTELRIGTSGIWYSSPYTFTGLSPATNYTVYARRKENASYYASSPSTGKVFTTDKGTQSPPSTPTISNLEFDRATVNGGSGTEVNINNGTWYDSPHTFTGLTAETSYTAYARKKETSTHYASSSVSKEFTTPSELKIYGVRIDTTNSNPETALIYTDDAVGFTPASGNNGSFNYGSWQDKFPFNQIKPCLYKNGAVNYYLNPNDYTKKVNGTSADIASGNDGDVMVEFPKMYWKFETVGNNLYIRYSDKKVDSSYKCLAHMRGTTEKQYAYLSAYLGYESSGKLRSLSGKTPTVSKTIGAFRSLAQANGTGYDQQAYYQLLMLQVLFIVMFKNRDSQTALGRGYVDGNSSSTSTGGTNNKGLFYGEATGKQQNKFCGIEDFWGNVYYWIDGFYSDANRNMLIGNQNFNDTGSGYTNYGQGVTSNTYGYIGDVQGGTETGFVIKASAGSTTTHYADYGDLYASRLTYFGGSWSTADLAGAFRLRVFYLASNVGSSLGARIMSL